MMIKVQLKTSVDLPTLHTWLDEHCASWSYSSLNSRESYEHWQKRMLVLSAISDGRPRELTLTFYVANANDVALIRLKYGSDMQIL